ncbi:MAG: M56 family metallopeptidase [Patescibacteria group bacterium]
MKQHAIFLRLAPYGVLIGFGLVLWSVGTLLLHAWPYLYLLRSAPAPCGCSSLQTISDDPKFFSMLLGIAGLMSLYLVAAGVSLICQLLQTRRFLRTLTPSMTAKNQHLTWQRVQHSTPWSFTAGLIHPQIFLSTATTSQLSEQETASVLAHEQYHARHFHPLARWLLQGLFSPIRWIPGFRTIEQTVILAQEYAADTFAVQSNGKQNLLRAFTKLANADAPAIPVPSFHVTNLRLRLLLGEPIQLPVRKFSGALLSLAGIFIATHAVIGAGPLSSNEQNNSLLPTPKMCIQLIQQERTLQSEISNTACPILLQSQPAVGITQTHSLE